MDLLTMDDFGVQMLVDRGADLSARGPENCTALTLAAQDGRVDVIQVWSFP